MQKFARGLLVTGALTCKYCVCQPGPTCPLLRIPAIGDGPSRSGDSSDGGEARGHHYARVLSRGKERHEWIYGSNVFDNPKQANGGI